jgi:hypothetical protein
MNNNYYIINYKNLPLYTSLYDMYIVNNYDVKN